MALGAVFDDRTLEVFAQRLRGVAMQGRDRRGPAALPP